MLHYCETNATATESLINMKRILLVLTLGAALATPSFAQSTPSTNAPPPGGHHDHDMAGLTDAEKQELKAAHDAAITADPTLGTDGKALMDQMKAAHESGQPPSDDLKAQMHAFREKMNAAMIKADPNVAPIIAKLEAAHKHHDGPPPATPSAT